MNRHHARRTTFSPVEAIAFWYGALCYRYATYEQTRIARPLA